MRTPQLEWDRALRAESQRWLSLLPEEVKPNELCSAYPRIANRLALIWPERAAIKSYFDDLMIDKRGGRVGFSQGIRDELLRLRGFHDSSMSSPQAVREWKDRMASSSEAGARRRAGSAADGRSS